MCAAVLILTRPNSILPPLSFGLLTPLCKSLRRQKMFGQDWAKMQFNDLVPEAEKRAPIKKLLWKHYDVGPDILEATTWEEHSHTHTHTNTHINRSRLCA